MTRVTLGRYAKESTQLDEWGRKIVDEVHPMETDIVVNPSSSALVPRGTELSSIINDREIQSVILLGFLSHEAIVNTAIHLSDEFPDLNIIVCSDGTASTRERHLGAMRKVRYQLTLNLCQYEYILLTNNIHTYRRHCQSSGLMLSLAKMQ